MIEGVMMRGVRQTAMAVRKPDQSIDVEVWDNRAKPGSSRWKRIPFVRGIFNMIDSLLIGYRCLMKSAEVSGMELEEEELTVENIKKHSRFHPRCGTSFLILVLILGILIFSAVTWSNPLIRTLLKLALLPVVIGIAYELIKLAGRYDNLFTKIISFPGLKLQHLTTNEPDGDQIEVAIASLKPVLPQTEGEDRW